MQCELLVYCVGKLGTIDADGCSPYPYFGEEKYLYFDF